MSHTFVNASSAFTWKVLNRSHFWAPDLFSEPCECPLWKSHFIRTERFCVGIPTVCKKNAYGMDVLQRASRESAFQRQKQEKEPNTAPDSIHAAEKSISAAAAKPPSHTPAWSAEYMFVRARRFPQLILCDQHLCRWRKGWFGVHCASRGCTRGRFSLFAHMPTGTFWWHWLYMPHCPKLHTQLEKHTKSWRSAQERFYIYFSSPRSLRFVV